MANKFVENARAVVWAFCVLAFLGGTLASFFADLDWYKTVLLLLAFIAAASLAPKGGR